MWGRTRSIAWSDDEFTWSFSERSNPRLSNPLNNKMRATGQSGGTESLQWFGGITSQLVRPNRRKGVKHAHVTGAYSHLEALASAFKEPEFRNARRQLSHARYTR